MKSPLLKAIRVTKSFFYPEKITVLKEVSLTLNPGESLSIMGASGEGKTTLLHILGSLEKPDSGELQILGKTPSSQTRLYDLGFIFQNYNLLEDLTVLQNVLLPAKIGRKPTGKNSYAYKRALYLLDLVGLSSRSGFPLSLLSGGERQRCAIARALINNPSLLLADEPSGSLDYETSQKIHELLLYLAKKEKKGLVIATHDLELASLCEKKVLLKQGSLFFDKPKSPILELF